MLVLDASAALEAAQFRHGFAVFGAHQLVAPPLMWSEARSTLHEWTWRGEVSKDRARVILGALEAAPVKVRTHRRLGREACQIADELGWAKTYDAEYVALARLLNCRLVTMDGRLRRGADRLGFVIGPTEL